MRKRLYIEKEDGFTLLELLIATVILAIGLLGVAALQLTAIRGNAQGNDMTLASSAIVSQIEALKNSSYSAITSDEKYIVFVGGKAYEKESAPTDGSFYMKLVTTVVDNQPVNGTKDVTVEASWVDENNIRRHYSSRTLITFN